MPKRARYNAYLLGWFVLLLGWSGTTVADTAYGPWNLSIAAGSVGFSQTLPADAPVLSASGDWTISAWVRPQAIPEARQLMAGIGDADGAARYFLLDHGHLAFWWGHDHATVSAASLRAEHWQFVHQARLPRAAGAVRQTAAAR